MIIKSLMVNPSSSRRAAISRAAGNELYELSFAADERVFGRRR